MVSFNGSDLLIKDLLKSSKNQLSSGKDQLLCAKTRVSQSHAFALKKCKNTSALIKIHRDEKGFGH